MKQTKAQQVERTGICIVGAGAVGLALARALTRAPSLRKQGIVILEEKPSHGEGTSSRSSEVIHAGLYYPTGSLKATLCVHGKALLYDYLKRHSLPHRRLGKLVVAGPWQLDQLETLQQQARDNGVLDTEMLSPAQVKHLEPAIGSCYGLKSPSTGIFDSHAFMNQLAQDAQQGGAVLATATEVVEASHDGQQFVLHCRFRDRNGVVQRFQLLSDRLVNAAGLGAQALAQSLALSRRRPIPALYPCKGNYLKFNKKSPFSHLVYPVPDPSLKGLGIHGTLDLQGQLRFGPNTRYLDQAEEQTNYGVDPDLEKDFAAAIAHYFPAIGPEDLSPDYAGIRPKLAGPGQGFKDFAIHREAEHGVPGLIELFGIESPGLTASLAIAEMLTTEL